MEHPIKINNLGASHFILGLIVNGIITRKQYEDYCIEQNVMIIELRMNFDENNNQKEAFKDEINHMIKANLICDLK